MKPRLAVFDWDGTLRLGYSMQAFMGYLDDVGIFPAGTHAESERNYAAHANGEISHDELVRRTVDLYAGGLAGRAVDEVQEAASAFVDWDGQYITAFAAPMVEYCRAHGVATAIVSGSPVEILEPHAADLGIGAVYGTVVGIADDHYDGSVDRYGGLAEVKRETAAQLSAEYDIVLAVGDSESDRPILEAAHVAVAVGDAALAGLSVCRIAADSADFAHVRRALDVRSAVGDVGPAEPR